MAWRCQSAPVSVNALILVLSVFGLMQTPASDAVLGFWSNPQQSVIVEIEGCGSNLICGHVRWASEKATADAKAGGTDPLLGSELMSGFAPIDATRWRGRLFVPDLRKHSKADLILIGNDRLRITGCAVGKLVCKSQVWTRVPEPSPSASGNP